MLDEIWLRYADSQLHTAEISKYLRVCEQRLSQILKSFYTTVIEIGCSDGSFLMETILLHNKNYLGLDFQKQAINRLKSKLHKTNAGIAHAVAGDATNLYKLVVSHPDFPVRDTLIVFPFNVFGTFLDPCHILRQSYLLQSDVLIFSFEVNNTTTNARKAYYEKIMGEAILCHKTPKHVLCHSSSGFYSYVYPKSVMVDWLRETGYSDIAVFQDGEIDLIYYGRFVPSH